MKRVKDIDLLYITIQEVDHFLDCLDGLLETPVGCVRPLFEVLLWGDLSYQFFLCFLFRFLYFLTRLTYSWYSSLSLDACWRYARWSLSVNTETWILSPSERWMGLELGSSYETFSTKSSAWCLSENLTLTEIPPWAGVLRESSTKIGWTICLMAS